MIRDIWVDKRPPQKSAKRKRVAIDITQEDKDHLIRILSLNDDVPDHPAIRTLHYIITISSS